MRLIFIEREQVKHPEGVLKYTINPQAVFDQVMIDPRISYQEFRAFKQEVMRTGLAEKQIKRLLLYKPPTDFVVELPAPPISY